ncbi:MAG: aminotransferase class III-fold pyridoxal phosphate-dependent enzyme [Planctomycetota bacterium]
MPATTLSIENSRRLLQRSDALMVRGCQGHKRNHMMLERGYPVFASAAKGARFTDVDGNELVDYLMGFGPIVLGHGDPAVAQAVHAQLVDGVIFSTAHERELVVAERLLSLFPWAGRIGFAIGGSAATSQAIRLARAYTGREVILRCGYHGWHDWTAIDPIGVPAGVQAVSCVIPYNDLEALRAALAAQPVAGVIVETIQESGPDAGYLQGVIDAAREAGAVSILDEVKTGCRVAIGGACELYGLEPDIATFGKAWCNGLPGAFFVGKEEILSDDRCQQAWLAATFHCELASFAALEVVLDRLEREDGIAHQARLGTRFMEGINAACKAGGVGYQLAGHPAMPQPLILEDKPKVIRMLQGALQRGHYIHPGHCMFFSLAHTEADIESAIAAVEASIAELD